MGFFDFLRQPDVNQGVKEYKNAAKISKKHAKIGEKGENRIHNLFKITRLRLC